MRDPQQLFEIDGTNLVADFESFVLTAILKGGDCRELVNSHFDETRRLLDSSNVLDYNASRWFNAILAGGWVHAAGLAELAISAVASTPDRLTCHITWSTNLPSTSRVYWGLTSSYGTSHYDSALVYSHSVTIAGLDSATLYHFKVESITDEGQGAESADYTFTTLACQYSYSGTIAAFPFLTASTGGTHRWVYAGSIPAYPAIESPTTGPFRWSYAGHIPAFPKLVSPTYSFNPLKPPGPPGLGSLDVIGSIDAIDKGLRPDHLGGMGGQEFLRSCFILDTTDYDGTVTYRHQIIAKNLDIADADVTLKTFAGAVVSTITVPAGTTEWTMITANWTPTPGLDLYYWHVPDVGFLASSVLVATGRVVISQIGATKTLLWRPVADDAEGLCWGFNQQISLGYSWGSPAPWSDMPGGVWYWNPSLYVGSAVSIVLEACLGSAWGDVGASACLWDVNTDTMVAGSMFTFDVGGAFSWPSAIAARHEFNSALLTAGHLYKMRYRREYSSGGVTTYWLSSVKPYRGAFMVRVQGMKEIEVAWRVAKCTGSPVIEVHGSSRVRLDKPGNSIVKYIKNETCSAADFALRADPETDYWITDDDHLNAGDGNAATDVPHSNAHQDPVATLLPIFSDDWKDYWVPGNSYCFRLRQVGAGSDSNAKWTLILMGLKRPTDINPHGCFEDVPVCEPVLESQCMDLEFSDSEICGPGVESSEIGPCLEDTPMVEPCLEDVNL